MNRSVIEQLFRSALSIQFHVAFEPTEPPVMLLVVNNSADTSLGYGELKKSLTSDLIIAIKVRNEVLDIAIRNPVSLDEIKIRNLSFDQKQFENYCSMHSSSEAFVFMMGYYESGYLLMIYPEQHPDPIRIQGYKIE